MCLINWEKLVEIVENMQITDKQNVDIVNKNHYNEYNKNEKELSLWHRRQI